MTTETVDLAREDRIRELREVINSSPAIARLIWPIFEAEINARSPEQVRAMERERGLD